jgi:hypothetical protein
MKKPALGRISLGSAAVVDVECGGVGSRFRVHSAWIEVLPAGKTPVHLRLEGDKGSLTLELPLVQAWRLSAEMHERAIGFGETAERTGSVRKQKKPKR